VLRPDIVPKIRVPSAVFPRTSFSIHNLPAANDLFRNARDREKRAFRIFRGRRSKFCVALVLWKRDQVFVIYDVRSNVRFRR
jgi:hypothetical protein